MRPFFQSVYLMMLQDTWNWVDLLLFGLKICYVKLKISFKKELLAACFYVLLRHLIAVVLNLTLRFKLSDLSIKHFWYLHKDFQAQDLFQILIQMQLNNSLETQTKMVLLRAYFDNQAMIEPILFTVYQNVNKQKTWLFVDLFITILRVYYQVFLFCYQDANISGWNCA